MQALLGKHQEKLPPIFQTRQCWRLDSTFYIDATGGEPISFLVQGLA